MRNRRRGSTTLEVAILTPVIVLLLVGMTQIAQMTWTYYTLRKTVYSIGSYLNAQQGVNFCDPTDQSVANAISFGVTASNVNGLTTDMISITGESLDPTTQTVVPFGGCSGPDFIVVSIPNGYPFTPAIPFFSQQDAIALKPQVTLPYAGT